MVRRQTWLSCKFWGPWMAMVSKQAVPASLKKGSPKKFLSLQKAQLRRNLPNPASLQRLLQRRTHSQRSCWQRLWTAARAWLKVKLLPRSVCRKFLPVLLLGPWVHVSWDSLASLWKGLKVPVQRQHQQKSQQWLPSLQRLCTWQPRTLGLPVAVLVGSKWAASVKRGTS